MTAKILLLALLVTTAAPAEPNDDYKVLEAKLEAQERWMREAILAQEEKAKVALQAAERAVSKSEVAMESRFQSVNEFRATLSDQSKNFITRSEALAYFAFLVAFAAWHQKKQATQ